MSGDDWDPGEGNAARMYARRAREDIRKALAEKKAVQVGPAVPVRRVLVTGSRNWTDWETIGAALEDANPTVVVHGACYPEIDRETGVRPLVSADWIAHLWCTRHAHIPDEPYPADWRHLGVKAGPLRNAAMVAKGADLCLAFILDGSRGASGCVELAEKAGIRTEVYTASSASRGTLTA
ncbi:hypothetical protein ABN028_19465 [Actinopolymorpha sp. B17G11]|uniref:hypothetical protein n=1 Tax=Actinopolymorpha sp. B17G11 TaxID=3160861 RepID=UPI0032E3C8D1